MGGLLHPEGLGELPAVEQWLSHAQSTARIMRENYQHITDDAARMMTTVEENVLVQLENLRSHPSVASALARDELKLHGWVYKFESGPVYGYESTKGQFVAVDQATALPNRSVKQLSTI